jgi:hypothetical protein
LELIAYNIFALEVAYVSVPAKKKVIDSLIICSSLFSKRGSLSIIVNKSPFSASVGSLLMAYLLASIILEIKFLT